MKWVNKHIYSTKENWLCGAFNSALGRFGATGVGGGVVGVVGVGGLRKVYKFDNTQFEWQSELTSVEVSQATTNQLAIPADDEAIK